MTRKEFDKATGHFNISEESLDEYHEPLIILSTEDFQYPFDLIYKVLAANKKAQEAINN